MENDSRKKNRVLNFSFFRWQLLAFTYIALGERGFATDTSSLLFQNNSKVMYIDHEIYVSKSKFELVSMQQERFDNVMVKTISKRIFIYIIIWDITVDFIGSLLLFFYDFITLSASDVRIQSYFWSLLSRVPKKTPCFVTFQVISEFTFQLLTLFTWKTNKIT